MKDWPQGLNSWAKPATAATATVQAVISNTSHYPLSGT